MKRFNTCIVVCALALAGLQGCVVVTDGDELLEDVVISFSIDDEYGPGVCNTWDIDFWRVSLVGPEDASADVECDSNWDTANAFTGAGAVIEGTYTITVEAIHLDGGPVFQDSISQVVDALDSQTPDEFDFPFVADDALL